MLKKIIGPVNNKIILVFLLSNFFSMVALLILPAKAQQQNIEFLLILNLSFIFLICFISILTYKLISPRTSSNFYQNDRPYAIRDKFLITNVKILILFPILGFIFMFIDRVFIRGIDYSQGLRVARYDWLETTGGSFFGVVGNLLIPMSYVGIFVFIMYFQRIKGYKFWLMIAVLIGVFGHAALNGGRSNLLLALVMVIIAFILKQDKPFKYKLLSLKSVGFLSIGLGAFYYIAYIIESSASMGGATLAELVPLGVSALYGLPDSEFFSEEHSYLVYIFTYVLSYLYHGQWTAQITSFLAEREGFYFLTSLPTVMMDKYGLLDLQLDQKAFAETGAFISFPGAMYYDFGWFGVFFISSVLGCVLGLVMVFLKSKKPIGAFRIVVILFVLYTLILSPILPAYGLSYLMFILFSFVLLSMFNALIFRRRVVFI